MASSFNQTHSRRLRAKWLLGLIFIRLATQEDQQDAQEMLEKAELYLAEALSRCRSIDMVDYEADLLLAWAHLDYAKGDNYQARKACTEALAITKRSAFQVLEADVYNLLAQLELEGAYIEYAFLNDRKLPLADPENVTAPRNPWHDYDRSITLPHNPFTTPPQPQHLRGKISEQTITSLVFEDQRVYYVYEPPTFPYTTLYVQDGKGYYDKLRFHEVTDVLIEQGLIQPIRLVMIEPQDRHREYWFDERYEHFLLQEISPAVDRDYGTTKEKGTWGASLGGLVSAWLAWRNPQIFTKIGSQSGCFKAHPDGGNEYSDPEWFTEQFASTPRLPLRFYYYSGN